MPYGKKECVDFLIRDMCAQKLPLKAWLKDESGKIIEEQTPWVECQVRLLPGGFYEFIFPKEYMAQVLTSLWFNRPESPDLAYNINKEFGVLGFKIKPIDYIRKFLRLEDPPEFAHTEGIAWYNQHIGIIPIGIRHDGVVKEANGWEHEAI